MLFLREKERKRNMEKGLRNDIKGTTDTSFCFIPSIIFICENFDIDMEPESRRHAKIGSVV